MEKDRPAPNEEPAGELPEDGLPPLSHRLFRAVFAPDVLEDGGHDAPLSKRGRILFWGIVTTLVVAIAVLLVATAATR